MVCRKNLFLNTLNDTSRQMHRWIVWKVQIHMVTDIIKQYRITLAIYKYLILYLFVFYYLTAYIVLNNLYNKSKQYGNSVLSSPLFCVKWTICKYAFILMSMSVVGLQQIVSSSAKKCNIPRLRTVVFVM